MIKEHEYSSIEKINDKKSIQAMRLIPQVDKILYSTNKPQFISFFAAWCPNCDYEAIELKKYYDRYNIDIDFSLIMQFCSIKESDRFINKYLLNMKIIHGEIESKSENLNTNTLFYKFRKKLADNRKWGVPLHLIIKPNRLLNEIFVIKGESINSEVERLLAS
jgi:thiol-disulfide isomerase/thioredoxin|tara:strand:+ start:1363 stop:1851 length:489 start_codon:yes stop_codon:yes gene_type:complete